MAATRSGGQRVAGSAACVVLLRLQLLNHCSAAALRDVVVFVFKVAWPLLNGLINGKRKQMQIRGDLSCLVLWFVGECVWRPARSMQIKSYGWCCSLLASVVNGQNVFNSNDRLATS